VTPANPSVLAGGAELFTATGTYSDSSTQDLTADVVWASTNTSAATIATGGLATAGGGGTTTISATFGGVSGNTTLTVTPVLISVEVTPADSVLNVSGTQPFTATGTFSDATILDLTAEVSWASSDLVTATIDVAGVATALAVGTAAISATLDGVTGNATLTVL
jgi:hypothetical protein